MIQSIRLQNFKGIRDVEVGLERLTVFVGPNGSGKTSFLEGLQYSSRLAAEKPITLFDGDPSPLQSYNRIAWPDPMESTCSTTWGDLYWSATPPKYPKHEGSDYSREDWEFQFLAKQTGSDEMDWKKIKEVPAIIENVKPVDLLRLDASIMARPSQGIYKNINFDGRGLASVLAYMQGNQPDNFALIAERLKQVVPVVDRVRFDRIRKPSVSHNQNTRKFRTTDGKIAYMSFIAVDDEMNSSFSETILLDFIAAKSVPAHLVSEGTLLALGLITVLTNNNRPNLVLLDDLDRGLHPLAQRDFIALIRTILNENPELQIVATTHSPYLVDSLKPEEVRMTTLNDDGSVACGRLVDHPKFEQWKNEMAPGEMWSMFGEKWVSQNPAQAAEVP